MFLSSDTIFAVSSPTSDRRVIIRISGPGAFGACNRLTETTIPDDYEGILPCKMAVDRDLRIASRLYVFHSPRSYTGEDMVEIHLDTNGEVTTRILENLAEAQLRAATGGEFTARRYLNGKIDLSQAEAVAETVSAANRFQLEAAASLLAGGLSEAAGELVSSITDLLSLIELALDFSGEDLEFIDQAQVLDRIDSIRSALRQLLAGGIRCESVIEMPSVAIVGTSNTGKSSLLNALLGTERSIVSAEGKTTRDVLTGLLELADNRCVLFDCAGLAPAEETADVLDRLAQDAALQAIRNSRLVLFCVDASKPDWTADLAVHRMLEPKNMLAVATKSDLPSTGTVDSKTAGLEALFGTAFLPVSSRSGNGIEQLRNAVDRELTQLGRHRQTAGAALTARHRKAVKEAMGYMEGAAAEIADYEVVAMLLRNALRCLSTLQRQELNEQVLQRIFSRFCIGK